MTNTSAAVDPLAPFRLDGKVALVTGASSGLGDRFARVLAAAGATVVVAARRVDRLQALAAELDGAVALPCDVGDEASVEQLVASALEAVGTIDVLVNNAGTSATMAAEEEPVATFRQVLDVNLVGLFHLSQLVGRHMLASGGGSIVNVASILGVVASGQIPQASYSASKAGVINLSRELAVQWARRGVRVNALCPGWFPSEMTDELFADEAGARFLRRNTPMGRGGEAHELDGALLFLASDAGSFVTGQTLVVDGGWLAR
jgi:NAD(P)-dependent dehydrogenase (short-subunit alcohol dehydrogenase family)